MDGTLIGCSSERTFFLRLLREGIVGPRDAARWLARAALECRTGMDAAVRGNRAYLAGKPAADIAARAADHARNVLRAHIPDAAWEAVRAHQKRGEPVFLVSGSLDILVAPLAAIVGADGYRASTLAIDDDLLTGRLDGLHPVGEGKVEVGVSLAAGYGFSLEASAAYGDRISDARLMARVAHPVAVSPRRALARHARGEGWPIADWHGDGRT